MIDRIDAFLAERESLVKSLRAEFRNEELSLEARWALFLRSAEILPNEIYGDGFINTLNPNGSLYDDFYVERRETQDYKDMDERIVERIQEEGADDAELYAANYDAWREAVLKSGYGSFTYDW